MTTRQTTALSHLLQLPRQLRQRRRNLAELAALEGTRLRDIGLSEYRRHEIVARG